MTRGLFLLIAFVGITLPVLLAVGNLLVAGWSLFPPGLPLSFSARLYSRWPGMGPRIHASLFVATSCLILLSASLLLFGLWQPRPETPLKPGQSLPCQSKSDYFRLNNADETLR